jgi:hypothetical protein
VSPAIESSRIDVKYILSALVPRALSVPFTVRLPALPNLTTTPGSMVSVTLKSINTGRSTRYGLPDISQVVFAVISSKTSVLADAFKGEADMTIKKEYKIKLTKSDDLFIHQLYAHKVNKSLINTDSCG